MLQSLFVRENRFKTLSKKYLLVLISGTFNGGHVPRLPIQGQSLLRETEETAPNH
jgi:hypothetical protein